MDAFPKNRYCILKKIYVTARKEKGEPPSFRESLYPEQNSKHCPGFPMPSWRMGVAGGRGKCNGVRRTVRGDIRFLSAA